MPDLHRMMGPTGTYRPCPTCQAPIKDPFPEDWEVELIKESPAEGPVRSFLTIHTDGCTAPYADPQPGIALRLPGRVVASIGFSIAPGPLAKAMSDSASTVTDPGYLFTADPETPIDGGWIPVGYTDAGMTSTDGVTWTAPVPVDDITFDGVELGPGTIHWGPVDG